MPCGCGGSSASTRQAPRREATRQTREQRQPRPPASFGDAGFTWNGPAGRSETKPPAPEPAKTNA